MVESVGKLGWGMWILINFSYLNKVAFIYEVECSKSKNEARNCDFLLSVFFFWNLINIARIYQTT